MRNNKIVNEVIQGIKSVENLDGVSLGFSINVINKLKETRIIKDISKYIDSEEIEYYIDAKHINRRLLVDIVCKMIEDEKIEINFTDKIQAKDLEYLKKLSNTIT